MKHFFSHWEQHFNLPDEVRYYFEQHGRVKNLAKGSKISQPYAGKALWCYVCTGLVAGVTYNEDGDQHIQWFAPHRHFFTSTKHLFTRRRTEFIEVFQPTLLLEMDRVAAKEGQQKYPIISELFHILKQRRMEQYQTRNAIMNEKSALKRYAYFMDHMPDIAKLTTPSHHRAYLRMSRERYQFAKRAYLHRRIP